MSDIKIINGAYIMEESNQIFLFNPYLFTSKRLEKMNSIDETLDFYRKELYEEGVLFRDKFNYNTVSDFFVNKEIYNFDKLRITDAMSYACNLQCKYCMQQNTFKDIRRMGVEEKFKLWMGLIDFLNSKELDICMFGGEPLLFYRDFEELFKMIGEQNVNISNISIVTNGTICNDNIIKFINKSHISSLQVTVDGTEKVHNSRRIDKNKSNNSFELIISNIGRILEETDSIIIINTVLDKSNKSDYLNMVDFMISKFKKYIFGDMPRIIFNLGLECHPFKKSEYTDNNIMPETYYQNLYYKTMYELIEKGVAINSILPSSLCIKNFPTDLITSPDGGIYNCISGLGIDDFLIGNYEDMVERPIEFLVNLINKKQRYDYNCNICEYKPLCNGGCYYELVSSDINSTCQKNIFNKHIKDIIKIASIVEEIDNNTFRRRDYGDDF